MVVSFPPSTFSWSVELNSSAPKKLVVGNQRATGVLIVHDDHDVPEFGALDDLVRRELSFSAEVGAIAGNLSPGCV